MTLTSARRKWTPPKFALALDWETSGYSYPNYAEKHQGIAVGAAVIEVKTLEVWDHLYQEIIFDEGKYQWEDKAEAVHGLSREHLKAHGSTQADAALAFGNLVVKYWASSPVMIIGHNPTFDIAFTRQLLEPFGIMFELYHRQVDTSGVSLTLMGTPYADDMFELLKLPERQKHNALEDVLMTVEALRVIRTALQRTLI